MNSAVEVSSATHSFFDGPVRHFTLHVRGGGDPITPVVLNTLATSKTRLVSNGGCFHFKKQVVFLSQALKQEWIGLEEIDDGLWSVHFCDVVLARLDERSFTLQT
ncbi:MAG TPA: hypothetical protein VGS57_17160 [Thermoanaerobaculia bacterium]|jgi:hypothetical protein|nr:hypothetical protein [Thermoanaerobaculia bacterium]